MQAIVSFFTAIIMFIAPMLNYPKAEPEKDKWNTDYAYIFVHGLSGWGEYDFYYDFLPYWGMFGGDMMKYLNARGYTARAASVDPQGSAWDRACELYAQLTGTRVDYGEAHSKRCNHSRYGDDFTGRALIGNFSEKHKINLLGHSFGGATILLFTELMANGSPEEQKAGGDISPFFTGGKGSWIYSITTLASPLNGTTAYNIGSGSGNSGSKSTAENGKPFYDSAAYDMYIDNAIALMENIETLSSVYYFSFPCCCTKEGADGYQVADENIWIEPYVKSNVDVIGSYRGVTPGGVVLDEKWWPNDGLVNTYSAMAPFNAPQKAFDSAGIEPGIWNVMPVYAGDHQAFNGDLLKPNNIRPFFTKHIEMINAL